MLPTPSPNLARTSRYNERSLVTVFLDFFRVWGRTIIIVCQLVVISCFLWRFFLDERLAVVNVSLQNQMRTLDKLKPVETRLKTAQAKIALLKLANSDQFDITKPLEALSQNLPTAVYLLNLSLDRHSLFFSAKTASAEGLGLLVENLKKQSLFKEVTMRSAWYETDGSGFILEMEVSI